MNDWYGLKVDGELMAVIRWGSRGRPTTFDFHFPLSSASSYEVVPVHVEEEEGSW